MASSTRAPEGIARRLVNIHRPPATLLLTLLSRTGQPESLIGGKTMQTTLDRTVLPAARPTNSFPPSSAETLLDLLRLSCDLLDYPLLSVDSEHRVHWANRAARLELQEAGRPLSLQSSMLKANDAVGSDLLHRAVRQASSKNRCCVVRLGAGEATVSIAVMPLKRSEVALPRGMPQVLMAFGRRHVCSPLSAEWFARSHGLTGAEGRVLRGLSTGLCAREIAARQSVAISTVRTHVRSLRSKTGVNSIGALMQTLALLPPIVSAGGDV